ncbi:MAG: transglutaminase family protein [Pseudomonadota bacterium]
MDNSPKSYVALAPGTLIDADHPDVIAFASEAVAGATDERSRVARLYLAVRDRFRYDPYRVDLSEHGLKASTVLANGYGWCVPKAVLLAAACRAVGIPARLGLADVRNHLSTERLLAIMGTDMFYGHGYTAIQVEGRWLKATPAFNIELCQKFGLRTLEFDGTQDSIQHAFDNTGRRHMEYVQMRGEYDDVPREQILEIFDLHYPNFPRLDRADLRPQASWEADVLARGASATHSGKS